MVHFRGYFEHSSYWYTEVLKELPTFHRKYRLIMYDLIKSEFATPSNLACELKMFSNSAQNHQYYKCKMAHNREDFKLIFHQGRINPR